MKAIVLAGGKGTRLAPYTKILPKPLMPIGDMPILEILLRQLARCGVDEVILTVGHLAHLLCAFFQGGERYGLKINYSYEEKPLGTAGPLSLLGGLDDTFLVTNGDVLTTLDIKQLIEFHHAHHGIATIASHARKVRIDLGVIQTNSQHEIIGYLEKPCYDYCVSMGIYIFEPAILKYIGFNQYLDLPDLVLKLIEAGERVMSYPFDGYWMDLGRVEDYEQAVAEFEGLKPQILGEQFVESGVNLLESRLAFQDFLAPANNKPRQP
jgi:NDP-sugar pyrophosphorylase family protein